MLRPAWLTRFHRHPRTAGSLFERGFFDGVGGRPCESTRREYMLGWVQGAEAVRRGEPARGPEQSPNDRGRVYVPAARSPE